MERETETEAQKPLLRFTVSLLVIHPVLLIVIVIKWVSWSLLLGYSEKPN